MEPAPRSKTQTETQTSPVPARPADPGPAPAHQSRPLSSTERAFWLLDRGTRWNGVQVAALRGPIDVAVLRAALGQVQARHPLLRVRVVGGDRRPAFTTAGAGPLPLRVLPRHSDTAWQAAVEEELNAPFPPDGDHLTRLSLLQGAGRHELVFAHHHVTADALSGVYAVRDLLSEYARRCEAGPGAPAEPEPGFGPGPGPALALRPPLAALLPAAARGVPLFWAMHRFFRKYVLGRAWGAPRPLPREQAAPPAVRRNRLVHLALPPDETAALAERAREAGTTVHAAICAALLLAAGETAYAGEDDVTAGCFTAVNLRGELTEPVGEEMGLYISQVTTFHRIAPPPPLWSLAREVKAQLKEALAHGEQYLTMPLIGLFIPGGRDPAPGFIRRFDGGSPAALGVTNVAQLPIPRRYGPLVLDNYQITVGLSVVGQLLGAVTTFAGTLNLNLIYVEPLVSEARARAIAHGALSRLREALAAERAA